MLLRSRPASATLVSLVGLLLVLVALPAPARGESSPPAVSPLPAAVYRSVLHARQAEWQAAAQQQRHAGRMEMLGKEAHADPAAAAATVGGIARDDGDEELVYPPGTVFYRRQNIPLPKGSFFTVHWYVPIIIIVVGVTVLYILLCVGICIHFEEGDQRRAKKVVASAYAENGFFDVDAYLERSDEHEDDSDDDDDDEDDDEDDASNGSEMIVVGTSDETARESRSDQYYAGSVFNEYDDDDGSTSDKHSGSNPLVYS